MSTGEFCTREVVITEKGTSILEVAQLMRTYHVGDVIVVERRGEQAVPVGILTDRDIVVELIAQEVDLASVTVGDVMSYDLLSVREDEGIWESLLLMCDRGVRRIPVVNEAGGLEGILALDDMIELLAEELSLLARIAGRGPDRERNKLA
ncbi:MAG TPA: CBS domain-containing protein [Desulfobulbaceae bacterium]|nr:CBS domain-containing protein [Desulfobulbaceae bacterium]